jgi:hypothetical protein
MVTGLKWGALVGVAVYLVEVALALVENALSGRAPLDLTNHPVEVIPICLLYFVLLFSFSASGFYTGRETGKARLGAVAAVVTLVVQYLLGLLYTPASTSGRTTTTTQTAANPISAFLYEIVALLLFVGIAALLGWLGGRPGAQRFAQRQHAQNSAPTPSATGSENARP